MLFFAGIWPPPSAHAQQPPAAPGRLVNLGGRRLHLNCTGAGSPTVIVESGSGAFSIDWALVQPEVARFTRFCSYDRAGYAWSDLGPARDSVEQTVDDLHLLLQTADNRPPYVLVGASLGGLYIRAYQRRYPSQVAGLVFDDSTTGKSLGFPINGKNQFIVDISAQEIHDLFAPLLRNPPPAPVLPNTIEAPFDRLPRDDQAAWLWAIRRFIAGADIAQSLISAESWRESSSLSSNRDWNIITRWEICRWLFWFGGRMPIKATGSRLHSLQHFRPPAGLWLLRTAATRFTCIDRIL
jgi:pimeloyl-ACP methyl ester carboxylesterase